MKDQIPQSDEKQWRFALIRCNNITVLLTETVDLCQKKAPDLSRNKLTEVSLQFALYLFCSYNHF